jgi:hypothetical protein
MRANGFSPLFCRVILIGWTAGAITAGTTNTNRGSKDGIVFKMNGAGAGRHGCFEIADNL